MNTPFADFTFSYDGGTIALLQPISHEAVLWVGEHIPDDAQYFGNALAIEHRCIEPIMNGIGSDGLTVELV